jgi:FKBP-type peptidyl-prolyl cis-trans isomerase
MCVDRCQYLKCKAWTKQVKYYYNKTQRRGFIKKKLIFFVVAGTVICALAVSGTIIGIHKYDKSTAAKYSSNSGGVSSPNDLSSTGGLSVDTDPSAATNLGQLDTTSTSQNSSGTSSGASSTQSSLDTGSTSSSNASPADPSTFTQYNKYASNTSALFGDIQVGTGATISVGQTATVSYKGWLTDGTMFSQSGLNSSGQVDATTFVIGQHQVIVGLEEGVAGMKVGGTRLIIVPPSVGYGATGKGPVPANAVLVFEVSLLDAH